MQRQRPGSHAGCGEGRGHGDDDEGDDEHDGDDGGEAAGRHTPILARVRPVDRATDRPGRRPTGTAKPPTAQTRTGGFDGVG